MDAAIVAINDTISYRHRGGRLTAGVIVVLHTYFLRKWASTLTFIYS